MMKIQTGQSRLFSLFSQRSMQLDEIVIRDLRFGSGAAGAHVSWSLTVTDPHSIRAEHRQNRAGKRKLNLHT